MFVVFDAGPAVHVMAAWSKAVTFSSRMDPGLIPSSGDGSVVCVFSKHTSLL